MRKNESKYTELENCISQYAIVSLLYFRISAELLKKATAILLVHHSYSLSL